MKARHISIWLIVGYYCGKLRAVLLRMLGERRDLQDPLLRGEGCGVLIHQLPMVMGLGPLITDIDDLFILPCPAHRQSGTLMARVCLWQRHSTKSWHLQLVAVEPTCTVMVSAEGMGIWMRQSSYLLHSWLANGDHFGVAQEDTPETDLVLSVSRYAASPGQPFPSVWFVIRRMFWISPLLFLSEHPEDAQDSL